MPSKAIVVAPSALMHAARAYLSPEFQTFKSIIRLHSSDTLIIYPASAASLRSLPQTSLNSLPPEVLLIIQAHLLPLLISHLTTLSDHALVSYESSILSLLCADCREYNYHVHGPVFWNWPHFSGPCNCANIGSSCRNQLDKITRKHVNPKHFRNPHHWLEAHLSKHAFHILGARQRMGTRISDRKETAIWDLVADVLRHFECEVVSGDWTPVSGSAAIDGRNVSVIPAGLRPDNEEPNDLEEQRTIILRRAWIDLGLRYEYADVGGGREEDDRPFKASVAGMSSLVDVKRSAHIQPRIVCTLQVVWEPLYAPLTLLAVLIYVYCR